MTHKHPSLEEVLKLQGVEGASARLVHVQRLIARAKFTSSMSHYLALELIEKAVEKFDDLFETHMLVVRDFFGEFWQEIEKRAEETARESIREAIAWSGAARAFKITNPETKALVADLADATKTRTIPEFLAVLKKLKEKFKEPGGIEDLWRQTLDERFGPV